MILAALAVGAILAFVVYFLPSFIAIQRNHTSDGGIIVVNIFLGWTFLGWVVALAWAMSGQHKKA